MEREELEFIKAASIAAMQGMLAEPKAEGTDHSWWDSHEDMRELGTTSVQIAGHLWAALVGRYGDEIERLEPGYTPWDRARPGAVE